jgi:hypothetical protein
MRATLLLMLILLPAAGGAPAHAAGAPPANVPPLSDLPGVVRWSTLSKVGSVKARDGKLVPKYADEVAAMNNAQIKLQGFMMPLEPGEKQTHFLLTVTSPSCAYCLPAGPEGVVEIKATAPIKFTYTPVILSGTMNVLANDPMGLYYRLTNASAVSK